MPGFESSGTNVYYQQKGEGHAVVLLHGFTTSLTGNWERRGWIDLLAESGFRAVALDFPSHGRSERVYTKPRCSTERLAKDVVNLLDQLEIPCASLFGFSMGGGVALRAAMDSPSRVIDLIVGGVGDAALNAFHDPREIEELIDAFEADSADHVEAVNAKRIRRNAELAGDDPAALLPFLLHHGWPGGLSETRTIRSPVLLIVAEQDQYMPTTTELRAWLAHAEIMEVAGRHHHDVLADPAVKQRVIDFLSANPER